MLNRPIEEAARADALRLMSFFKEWPVGTRVRNNNSTLSSWMTTGTVVGVFLDDNSLDVLWDSPGDKQVSCYACEIEKI